MDPLPFAFIKPSSKDPVVSLHTEIQTNNAKYLLQENVFDWTYAVAA